MRALSRQQDEFERIAMPHSRSLLRFARRLTSDAAAAEDLVQETLLLAWRGFHQFAPGTNVRAWLFRILLNTFHAKGRRAVAVVIPIRNTIPAGPVPDAVEVTQALERLPMEQRTVILLGIVE